MGDCPLEAEQEYTSRTGQKPPAYLTRPQNIWPTSAPWFRSGLYNYYNAILPISLKVIRLLALALDLDEDAFMKDYFKFPITGMRPLHYPPGPADTEGGEESIGLGAHSDFSCKLKHLSSKSACMVDPWCWC